ncbi:MAG: hypothetical protein H6734_14465 [Alphaproteobacteria bacterium]|nr:hypothetical protein [Alphaproteobacteria bacterium]
MRVLVTWVAGITLGSGMVALLGLAVLLVDVGPTNLAFYVDHTWWGDAPRPCDAQPRMPHHLRAEELECVGVFVRDLPAGTTIAPTDVDFRLLSPFLLDDRNLRDGGVGRTLAEPVYRGELPNTGRLR